MSERKTLLESLATTVSDYRTGEIAAPTPEHVDRWLKQFDKEVQLPMLRELDHVLKQTYFSKKRVVEFLLGLVHQNKLTGANPCGYWRTAQFLEIQQNGRSQKEMLTVFDEVLHKECEFTIAQCGTAGGDFIYLDDAVFSGTRVGTDLERWIAGTAPRKTTVHVIVIAIHKLAEHQVKVRLGRAIAESGKDLEVKYWREVTIENRKTYNKDSEVLWPAQLPDDTDVKAYVALPHKYPFEARPTGGNLGPFSSEGGRQLLECELLRAGVKIRAACTNPKEIMRPLGFSVFGVGFGSMIVTFRNCPNNCPLALWWGDPDADVDHPLSKWHPLFPRKTYAGELDF